MIPKIVDWNTGTLEEFKNKFNTWNTHVSKIKNNPSTIPVNIRTKFKYIHGKGSSFGYTFANSYSAYNSSSGTLTEGNIDGRHLTYYSISATVKKMLDKMKYYKYKHWVNRGFFLGAKDSKVYGYLGWYNSSNGGQMPDYKPSSYSFRYAWYFPFTYLEYIELQKRIDLGYKKLTMD